MSTKATVTVGIGVNIQSAAQFASFTATYSGEHRFQVFLDNAVGNGDYVIYLKKQKLGAGNVYTFLAKTTATAANGETLIAFPTITIDLTATDVVQIWIDGLAGDAAVTGAVDVFYDDYLKPTTLGRTVAVDISGGVNVGSVQADAITAAAIAADAIGSSELAASAVAEIVAAMVAAGVVSFPAGAILYTYTVTDSGTGLPIADVEVWFSTDLLGANICWKGTTDAFGIARDIYGNKPLLDAGTYYVWTQKVGMTPVTQPDTEVVS